MSPSFEPVTILRHYAIDLPPVRQPFLENEVGEEAPISCCGDESLMHEQGNLSRALGSVVGTACLRSEGNVGPQLISHVFGLLKARDVEGLSEEDYWLATDEGTEWVIRTVDAILDVVKPEDNHDLHAKL